MPPIPSPLVLGGSSCSYKRNNPVSSVRLITGGAFRRPVERFADELRRSENIELKVEFSPPGVVKERILAGEQFDVVVIAQGTVDDLVKAGKVVASSTRAFARLNDGVAIRAGAPRPDISTVESFKKTLLSARSIVYSDPSTGAVSGVHFAKVIDELGIAKEVNAKAILNKTPATVANAEIVARVEAELGIQTTSEIVHVPGAELLGPLPKQLQHPTVVAAGVLACAAEPKVAQRLVQFLTSVKAAQILKEEGMEPIEHPAR